MQRHHVKEGVPRLWFFAVERSLALSQHRLKHLPHGFASLLDLFLAEARHHSDAVLCDLLLAAAYVAVEAFVRE